MFCCERSGSPNHDMAKWISACLRESRIFLGLCAEWSNSAIVVSAFCTFLLAVLLEGCGRPSVHEPITLTLLDQRWVSKQFVEEYEEELQQFTRETGIQV